MYSTYWRLRSEPFENSFEPSLFFASTSHQSALLKLRYLIEHRKGAGLVTGATGIGKSFLIHRLADELGPYFGPWVSLVFPRMSPDDLLTDLAIRLGDGSLNPTTLLPRFAALQSIEHSLHEHTQQSRHPVIVVDDANLIDDSSTLQTLELLLNFHQPPRCVFTLILLSDRSLLPKLGRMPRFDDRLAVRAPLQPLTTDEVGDYIHHRLEVCGADHAIFERDALREISERSGGIPRQINRLADLALLVGYADQHKILSAEQITAVSEELATTAAI